MFAVCGVKLIHADPLRILCGAQYLVKTVCAHLHQRQRSTQAVSLLATVGWAVCTYIINAFKRNSKMVCKIS